MKRGFIFLCACFFTHITVHATPGSKAASNETLPVTAFGQVAISNTILKKGRRYRITVSGTYSLWTDGCFNSPDGKPRGADAYYCYLPMGRCNPPPQKISGIALGSNGNMRTMIELAERLGERLEYNPAHVYSITLKGTNEPLRVAIRDTHYEDNCGGLSVKIEEL